MVQRILLVEDNLDDEALALRAFKKSGLDSNSVVVARDGEEALAYLLDQHKAVAELPTLVLLDINLPKLNGIDVLKRLRKESKTQCIPVVMLSSSKEERDISSSYEFGCNSYIRKPVDFNEFTDMIHQVQSYWLSLNEVANAR